MKKYTLFISPNKQYITLRDTRIMGSKKWTFEKGALPHVCLFLRRPWSFFISWVPGPSCAIGFFCLKRPLLTNNSMGKLPIVSIFFQFPEKWYVRLASAMISSVQNPVFGWAPITRPWFLSLFYRTLTSKKHGGAPIGAHAFFFLSMILVPMISS